MDKKNFAVTIVKYWYLLEFLSQPDFPTQNRAEREICKKAAGPGQGGPKRKRITLYHSLDAAALEPDRELARDAETYPRYAVASDEIELCIGKIGRHIFAEQLYQVFGQKINLPELPESDKRPVCLIGLKCDAKGRYIPNSIQLSPLAWGIHTLLAHAGALTQENLADYLSREDYQDDLREMEKMLIESDGNVRVGCALTQFSLEALTKEVEQQYLFTLKGARPPFTWEGGMIYRRYQTEEDKAGDTDALRNSELISRFFVNDLAMVREALADQDEGASPMEKALVSYIVGPYAEENPSLGWEDFSKRTDIYRAWDEKHRDRQSDFFHDGLEINKAPLGKWPSRFMPCLMQQLAINRSWKPTGNGMPIFSVNGPPGTGKTTLLKEIVAGNVVERAILLAGYADPDAAFAAKSFCDGDKANQGYSKFYPRYYEFKDEKLKDYGMLVASCNNAAVENITKELPDGTALRKGLTPPKGEDPAVAQQLSEVEQLFCVENSPRLPYSVWTAEKGRRKEQYPDLYFTKLANGLAKRPGTEWDRWGLISAPFGKMSNIKDYIREVLTPYIASFGSNDAIQKAKAAYPEAVKRFRAQLETVKGLEAEIHRISAARGKFQTEKRRLVQSMEQHRHLREQHLAAAQRMEETARQLHCEGEQAQRCLAQYQAEAVRLQGQVQAQTERKEPFAQSVRQIRQEIVNQEKERGLWDFLLEWLHRPTMRSRMIREQYALLEKAETALQQEEDLQNQLERKLAEQNIKWEAQSAAAARLQGEENSRREERQDCLKRAQREADTVERQRRALLAARQNYEAALKEAKAQQSDEAMTVLDEEYFEKYNSANGEEATEAQVENPWHTARYNRAREKLFYEALQLHKAFLLGSKSCLWNFKNLLLLWKEPREEDGEKRPVAVSDRDRKNSFADLLNTVFLLTPVISTTFASAGNMLSDIRKPNQIGCLIIDEAGQASPQMALGALFRCRRAVVVGDPKQVEPVVTNEMDLIKRIIKNDTTNCYQSKTSSVQGFADRLNTVGTTYGEDAEKTWVGCPLVVHRRCISPMFELSNALAYDQTMKQQTALPGEEKEAGFCIGHSGWINVSGSEANTAGKDHYVSAQGQRAWALIRTAFAKTQNIPSLFVITPFTTVKNGLLNLIRAQPEYRQEERFAKWAEQSIGTVHTFQGKEADEVIFLLGCDKNAGPAVRWVNTNIVNVAVTRAKYRLCILGDYTVWQQSPLFEKVKGILDSYALEYLRQAAQNPHAPQDRRRIEAMFKQTPGAESLTLDGEPDDALIAPLQRKLDAMWENCALTGAQMADYHLVPAELQSLPVQIRQRLTSAILLYDSLKILQQRYGLEDMDASCAGILFCKIMESLLKKVLLGQLIKRFPAARAGRGLLRDLPSEKVTIGNVTYLLNEETNQAQLALCNAVLFGEACDGAWWRLYAGNLEQVRLLRNGCCHSGPLQWRQAEKLVQILLGERELVKTMVGEQL